jgi:nitrite reductase (NADH) small subunit
MSGAGNLIWLRAAHVDEIPALGARVVKVGERAIAIFRTSDDRIFALLDRCPHRGGPLSQGIVHGSCVTCPLHDWVIRLDSGEALAPDEGHTERFSVRIEGGTVLLGLPRGQAAPSVAGPAMAAATQ